MAYKKPIKSKVEQIKSNLIKMKRPDGKTADVHPDEVNNYGKGGYVKI